MNDDHEATQNTADQAKEPPDLAEDVDADQIWDALCQTPESENLLERMAKAALDEHHARTTIPLAPERL